MVVGKKNHTSHADSVRTKGLVSEEKVVIKGTTVIPFLGSVSGHVGWWIKKELKLGFFHLPHKIGQLMRCVKDDLALGVLCSSYPICVWGFCYTGQTGCMVLQRCKDHPQCARAWVMGTSQPWQVTSLTQGIKFYFVIHVVLFRSSWGGAGERGWFGSHRRLSWRRRI